MKGNRIEQLLAVPGNKRCADCSAKRPRWASILFSPVGERNASMGMFVCSYCADCHRSVFGHKRCETKHIQSAEEWNQGDIDILGLTGNEFVNHVLEAELRRGDFDKKYIDADKKREAKRRCKFIKSKYKRHRYTDAILYHEQMLEVLIRKRQLNCTSDGNKSRIFQNIRYEKEPQQDEKGWWETDSIIDHDSKSSVPIPTAMLSKPSTKKLHSSTSSLISLAETSSVSFADDATVSTAGSGGNQSQRSRQIPQRTVQRRNSAVSLADDATVSTIGSNNRQSQRPPRRQSKRNIQHLNSSNSNFNSSSNSMSLKKQSSATPVAPSNDRSNLRRRMSGIRLMRAAKPAAKAVAPVVETNSPQSDTTPRRLMQRRRSSRHVLAGSTTGPSPPRRGSLFRQASRRRSMAASQVTVTTKAIPPLEVVESEVSTSMKTNRPRRGTLSSSPSRPATATCQTTVRRQSTLVSNLKQSAQQVVEQDVIDAVGDEEEFAPSARSPPAYNALAFDSRVEEDLGYEISDPIQKANVADSLYNPKPKPQYGFDPTVPGTGGVRPPQLVTLAHFTPREGVVGTASSTGPTTNLVACTQGYVMSTKVAVDAVQDDLEDEINMKYGHLREDSSGDSGYSGYYDEGRAVATTRKDKAMYAEASRSDTYSLEGSLTRTNSEGAMAA